MLKSCSRPTAQCIPTPGCFAASSRPSAHSRSLHPSARLDSTRPRVCRRAASHVRVDASLVKSTETVTYMRNANNGAEVYLVGTGHTLKASVDDVRSTMLSVKPQTVFLELCEERAEWLMSQMRDEDIEEIDKQSFKESKSSSRKQVPRYPFISRLVTGLDQHQRKTGRVVPEEVEAGSEFKAALLEANVLKARVVYGDQLQHETEAKLYNSVNTLDLLRIFAAMNQLVWWEASDRFDGMKHEFGKGFRKALVELAAQDAQRDGRTEEISLSASSSRTGFWNVVRGHKIEHVCKALGRGADRALKWKNQNDTDNVEEMDENSKMRAYAAMCNDRIRKASPSFFKILLDDRDEFMFQGLKKLEGKVVAVVGNSHVAGIERRWLEMTEQPTSQAALR